VPVPFDIFVKGAERSDLWRVLVLQKVRARLSSQATAAARIHRSCIAVASNSASTAGQHPTLCGIQEAAAVH